MTFGDSEVLGNDTTPWDCNACHNHWACSRGLFQWPTVEDNQGLVLVISLIPPCQPLPWEKPYSNMQCSLTIPPHACQDWKRMQGSPRESLHCWHPPQEAEVVKAEEVVEAEEVVALAPLGWTQVHHSRPVVPVGLVPYSLGDEQHHYCNHSHCSWRRAYLPAEKNQQNGGTGDSVIGATWGSPVTTHNSSQLATLSPSMGTLMEGAIVWLQVPPLGIADIVNTLWRSQQPQTQLELTEEQAPTPVAGSTLVMSQMTQDAWGNLSVDMVTCQLSIMGMGSTPQQWLVRCLPSRMPPNLIRWSSAAKICTPALPYHWQLSAPILFRTVFPWWFHAWMLICLHSYFVFTKSVLL